MSDKYEISYKQELLRKGIHLLSLSIPIIYVFINRGLALKIIIPVTMLSIIIDILSKRNIFVKKFFRDNFGGMLREHEIKKSYVLNGASWVLISASICILLFPKVITITAFTILILSDLAAALYGRRFGKTPFLDKSLEGSSAFVVTACIVIIAVGIYFTAPLSFYLVAIPSAIIGAIVEAASKRLKVDDNLSIPLSIGFLMWGGAIIAATLNQPFLQII